MQEGSRICADASVLINLCHVSRMNWLGQLPYRFLLLDDVSAEIKHADQIVEVERAISSGWLERATLDALAGGALFGQLRASMGVGEAACLAFAAHHECAVLCDEGGRFRAAATEHVGEHKLLGTVHLYTTAIKRGWLTVAEADDDKAILAKRRFAFRFASFASLNIQLDEPEVPPAD